MYPDVPERSVQRPRNGGGSGSGIGGIGGSGGSGVLGVLVGGEHKGPAVHQQGRQSGRKHTVNCTHIHTRNMSCVIHVP